MVVIDVRVAIASHSHIGEAMPGQLFQHVIEEADAGGDVVYAVAVQIDGYFNPGFGGLPLNGCATHRPIRFLNRYEVAELVLLPIVEVRARGRLDPAVISTTSRHDTGIGDAGPAFHESGSMKSIVLAGAVMLASVGPVVAGGQAMPNASAAAAPPAGEVVGEHSAGSTIWVYEGCVAYPVVDGKVAYNHGTAATQSTPAPPKTAFSWPSKK